MLTRIDEIMMGTVQYGDKLMMQLDPGGSYDNAVSMGQTPGFKEATRGYRKIGEVSAGLECDDVCREAICLPAFQEADCRIS